MDDEHFQLSPHQLHKLMRAAASCDLTLVNCTDVMTSKPRYIVSAIARDGGDDTITPCAPPVPDNPYEAYETAGGFLRTRAESPQDEEK